MKITICRGDALGGNFLWEKVPPQAPLKEPKKGDTHQALMGIAFFKFLERGFRGEAFS